VTLSAIVRQLRQLVLEHPECSEQEVFIDTDTQFVPVQDIVVKGTTVMMQHRLEDLSE